MRLPAPGHDLGSGGDNICPGVCLTRSRCQHQPYKNLLVLGEPVLDEKPHAWEPSPGVEGLEEQNKHQHLRDHRWGQNVTKPFHAEPWRPNEPYSQ